MATISRKYEEHFARASSTVKRIGAESERFVQFLRDVGNEALIEIRYSEQMIRDDLRTGIERGELATALGLLLQVATSIKRRIAVFTPGDPILQEQAAELERIRAWAQPLFDRATKPLPPLDESKLPPPTDHPKPEGYTSLDEALDWMAKQPE